MSKSMTLRELLNLPEVSKYLQPNEVENIAENYQDSSKTEPLFIKIFLGIAAWIAASFLIGAVSSLFHGKDIALISFGAISLFVAIVLRRSVSLTFFKQFALALALAGDTMFVVGCCELLEWRSPLCAFIVQFLVCAVSYPLLKLSFYRIASTAAVGVLCMAWIIDSKLFYILPLLIGVEMLLAGYLGIRKLRPAFFNPLTISSVIMLPLSLFIVLMSRNFPFLLEEYQFSILPSSLVLAVGIIVLCFHLAGGFELKQLRKEWLIIAVVLTAVLGFISSPGILAALGLLVLGYHRRDNFPMAMAMFSLVVFLILYYYQMDIDLAYKSAVIGGTGLVLLIACALVGRIQRRELKSRANSEVRA